MNPPKEENLMVQTTHSSEQTQSRSNSTRARTSGRRNRKSRAKRARSSRKLHGANGRKHGDGRTGQSSTKEMDVRRVFVRELLDVSDAHDQLGRLLQGIAGNVNDREIRDLLSFLESRTASAKRSLGMVLEEHDRERGRKRSGGSAACKPMRAMAQEATRTARATSTSVEADLLTVTNLQKMLHYLIASLGSLRAWSELVEDRDAVALFRNLTDEMKSCDRELTELSENELWSRGDSDGDGGSSWFGDSRRAMFRS
jgi:ferritin-like metal-binding protein YciE